MDRRFELLHDVLAESRPEKSVRPELWMLGSKPDSAQTVLRALITIKAVSCCFASSLAKAWSSVSHSSGTLYTFEYDQKPRAEQRRKKARKAIDPRENWIEKLRIKLRPGKPARSDVR